MLRYVAIILLVLACAQKMQFQQSATEKESLARDIAALEGGFSIAVVFEEGRKELTPSGQKNLELFAARARGNKRLIEAVKILVWADSEYPPQSEKAHPRDIILAKERAQEIKGFLRERIQNLELHSYNMAKRPGTLSSVTKNEEYALKRAIEEMGPTATKLENGELSYSKASKAIIIVEYKD
jgi:type IV pilus biogenesis protein CpaD/CtpE